MYEREIDWTKVMLAALCLLTVLMLLCMLQVDKSKCGIMQKFGPACGCLRKNFNFIK